MISRSRLALLLALLFPLHSAADFSDAMVLYQKQDFSAAFEEFTGLAGLGDHAAQFNLGVMYYKGQSVEKDVMRAYAWMALATQGGDADWTRVSKKIFDRFDDDEKLLAKNEREGLFAEYSDAAIMARLAPVLSSNGDENNHLARVRTVLPKYPNSMEFLRKGGFVDIVFAVAVDGSTRNYGIVNYSERGFIQNAIDTLKEWRYEPLKINGKPVEIYGQQIRINYLFADEFSELKVKNFIEDNKKKAEAGNANDQYNYALLLELVPTYTKIKIDQSDANHWYWKSATAGFSRSQFSLGRNLLYGKACTADSTKSLFWLQKAAENGATDAQYLLAIEMLSGARLAKNEVAAHKWLQKAADGGNQNAQLKLAWLLVTNADKNLRDAATATRYLAKVSDEYLDRLTYFETKAAVAAEQADFDAALKWQQQAAEEAKRFDMPMDVVSARFTVYQAHHAWVESL
jgi:TPR repeat protein